MDLTTNHFLFVSAALFVIGMMGVLTRRNILIVFMCVEMMVAAVGISLVAFSHETATINGQVFFLFALAVAAAESAVGLAIVVALSRQGRAPDVEEMQTLRN
ncbi:MAG: NADH-quinone oxidoreductase subunit NuoK [Thermomicrobiales bacterium]|nr:NADH-quinone oxidoreductase subunit NuoK [Thermomicrobiales bacterium]MCO5219665.1 NADH-quinone oxidoreductase subunit NuoK [Thermomicrobiales bacterium]MCO5226199.1 NADH-quinone oxidoreductase subunit NuoK [Thermomicrobiales bacterium]MCO5228369.1 NADH-quinone oxidoreductase subunit NuoK [Thermomicrobiales bacterium]